MSTVRLISLTQAVQSPDIPEELRTSEGLMAYCARVSSPKQNNTSYEKLLKYCARHGHWSVFEMSDMTLEIKTSRAIAQQILRHRSFSFQEYSQRYSESKFGMIEAPARRQDNKNRQNSFDDLNPTDIAWFGYAQKQVFSLAYRLYKEALSKNIAKECARMLLPLNTGTKMYMKGSIRSWIHYINVRTHESTQEEHRQIALEAKRILLEQHPSLKEILDA